MDTDVIVIGAGVAGLQCARRLQSAGQNVTVLESGDIVGGRVRTERIDGFLCDRGFQVLNPSYPAVRDWIDVPALELQRFGTGVFLHGTEETRLLAHPLRRPRHALGTFRSGLVRPEEVRALARWLGPTLLRPTVASRATDDTTLAASLDRAGLDGPLRRSVLDTFLAGVLADSTGSTSANYARLLLRSFVVGKPGLPRAGMQELPAQMSACLVAPVRLSTAAETLRDVGTGIEVGTADGPLRSRAAVVAVGPQDLAEFTDEAAPATRGLTTWWFRAPHPPRHGPFLSVDAARPGGGPAGPVWNAAVISEAAPSYAPPNQHLVQATTLLDRPDGLAEEAAVRTDLERIYATSTHDWEVLAHHVVPHAVPTTPPPLVDRSPQRLSERVFVCGDHRDTGSIQGALVSGDRAGRGVAGILGSEQRPGSGRSSGRFRG